LPRWHRAGTARAADAHVSPWRHHGDSLRCSVRKRVLPRGHHSSVVDPADERSGHGFASGGDRRHRDHYAWAAARCHPDALARRGAALVGTARRFVHGLCGPPYLTAADGRASGRGRRGGLVHCRRRGADATRPTVCDDRSRRGICRAKPAAPGQHRVVCPHRRLCACPRRTVARHYRDSAGKRSRRLLDCAGGRQRSRHSAGRRRSEHSDHAPAIVFEFFIRFLTGSGREFKPLPPPTIGKGTTMQEQF